MLVQIHADILLALELLHQDEELGSLLRREHLPNSFEEACHISFPSLANDTSLTVISGLTVVPYCSFRQSALYTIAIGFLAVERHFAGH